MSDYQAIYDAVCSRFSRCDPGAILREAAGEAFDISYAKALLQQEIAIVGAEMVRPSVLMRPTLTRDAKGRWFAYYGEALTINSVFGGGDSPAEAMTAFDTAWGAKS